MSNGLGVYPTIVNQDGFDFSSTGFEAEMSIGHDKLTGNFVGECADLSSSQKRSSTLPIAIGQFAPVSSPSAHPISTSPDNLILETVGNTAKNVHAYEPTSRASSLPLAVVSHPEPIFKSPTTPASAYPRTPGTHSPVDRRLLGQAAQQITVSPQQHAPATTHQPHPMQQYAGQFQRHFFAQSSGNFMPPLESSCSFSLLQFACPTFLVWFLGFTTILGR